MASAELNHEGHSKRDRILNALAVYPDEHQISNQAIAELTGASASYVYQLRAAIDEGELADDEIDAAHDDQLRAEYWDRIRELLDDTTERQPTSVDERPPPTVADADESAPESRSNGTVPVEEIQHVRRVMDRYREDAAFEREQFEGPGKDIAEEKYFMADRAIELIDDALEG